MREHNDRLYQYLPSELSRYSAFLGHFNHDSLAFIPRKKISIFTFVRSPKERLLSLYNFWRAHNPSHPSYHPLMKIANELTIKSFLQDKQVALDLTVWNHMTWAIIGERQWKIWQALLLAETDENVVNEIIATTIRPEIAKRLQEYIFIGLQEEFDISIKLLSKILQKQPPKSVRMDHTLEHLAKTDPNFKKHIDKQLLTSDMDIVLDQLLQLDNIVYEEGKKIFFKRLNEYPLVSG
jgi:hypothetical protein